MPGRGQGLELKWRWGTLLGGHWGEGARTGKQLIEELLQCFDGGLQSSSSSSSSSSYSLNTRMWNVNHSTTAFEIMKTRRPNPLAIYFLLCCPQGKNIFCYRSSSLIASHRRKNTPERRNFQVRWEMPTVPRYETRWESVGKIVVDTKPWDSLSIFRNPWMFQKLTKGSQWTSCMGTSGCKKNLNNFCAFMWKESHNSLVGESMMQLQFEDQILLTCDFFVGVLWVL